MQERQLKDEVNSVEPTDQMASDGTSNEPSIQNPAGSSYAASSQRNNASLSTQDGIHVDVVVLANPGHELLSDLCLADMSTEYGSFGRLNVKELYIWASFR